MGMLRSVFVSMMLASFGLGCAHIAIEVPPPQESFDVVVIGGGIAGLSAAYYAKLQGKKVLLLEMQDRVGGRVHTKRWSNGQYSEMGVQDLVDNEKSVMRLIEKLGLKKKLREHKSEIDGYYMNDTFYTINDWDKNVSKAIGKKEAIDLYGSFYELVTKEIGHLEYPLSSSQHIALDKKNASEWIEEISKGDPNFKKLVEIQLRVETDAELEETSALYAAQIMYDLFAASWQHLEGGNDQIITALEAQLSEEIRKGARVLGLKESKDKVWVVYETATGNRSVGGEAVVVAIPSSAVLKLQFDPPLSKPKKTALEKVKYGRYFNAHLVFTERFWQTKYKFPSWDSYADLPTAAIVDSTFNQKKGKEGVLSLFAVGKDADRYGEMSDEVTIADMLIHLEKLWPGISEKRVKGHHVLNYWKIAVPIFYPGYITEVLPEIQKPHGRVVFAGDYTEQPGIDGAVHSATRALIQAGFVQP